MVSTKSKLPPWLIIIGIILTSTGLWLNLVHAEKVAEYGQKITQLDAQRVELLGQVDSAQALIDEHAPEFAPHWSEGLAEDLAQAKNDLGDDGPVAARLENARRALEQGDLEPAKVAVDQVPMDFLSHQIEVRHILGPPTLYEKLAEKRDGAEIQLQLATEAISEASNYIETLKNDSWNKTHGLRFTKSHRTLIDAQAALEEAFATSTTVLDNNLIDLPLAHDQAVMVLPLVDEIYSQADQDVRISREADAEIQAAKAEISAAEVYIQASNYQTDQAQLQLETGAKALLAQAESAFWGNPTQGIEPDYETARTLASQARQAAQSAQLVAATPTPVPPTRTPRPPDPPVIYDSSPDYDPWNSGSGGTDDFGGYDPWDYDSGSDSGSWDSGSDWGSDSGSWDSGGSDWGSDSGSWDSGGSDWGSDSGSFDSDW